MKRNVMKKSVIIIAFLTVSGATVVGCWDKKEPQPTSPEVQPVPEDVPQVDTLEVQVKPNEMEGDSLQTKKEENEKLNSAPPEVQKAQNSLDK